MAGKGEDNEGRLGVTKRIHVVSSQREQQGEEPLLSSEGVGQKSTSWCMSVEGFTNHVTTDGSLL